MSLSRHFVTHSRQLDNEARQAFGRILGEDAAAAQAWVPRVDIKEEAERFVIFADLPGVDPNAIEVQMDKGILSIKGQRSTGTAEEGARFSRIERAHGTFSRSFALPDSANPEGVTAAGKHGVLEITIPKRAETTPRRIQVQ